MIEIGTNTAGIDRYIVLGKEIGRFGRSDAGKAKDLAAVNPGSELIYKDDQGNFRVNELKENGILFGTSNVSRRDTKYITLDAEIMKKEGINNPSISFVEDESSYDDNVRLGTDPNTSPDILKRLAGNEVERIRVLVGINPNTTTEVLKHLSHDNESVVRAIVAVNMHTPADVLKHLSHDIDEKVRAFVSINPNISDKIYKQLSNDPSALVRAYAVTNPRNFSQ